LHRAIHVLLAVLRGHPRGVETVMRMGRGTIRGRQIPRRTVSVGLLVHSLAIRIGRVELREVRGLVVHNGHGSRRVTR